MLKQDGMYMGVPCNPDMFGNFHDKNFDIISLFFAIIYWRIHIQNS